MNLEPLDGNRALSPTREKKKTTTALAHCHESIVPFSGRRAGRRGSKQSLSDGASAATRMIAMCWDKTVHLVCEGDGAWQYVFFSEKAHSRQRPLQYDGYSALMGTANMVRFRAIFL